MIEKNLKMNQMDKWGEVKKRNEIIGITEEIAKIYYKNSPIDPEEIAYDEKITFCYGNYKNYFDGLLQHKWGKFHIFINLDRVSEPKSARARFTFAHELGHFFIDTHRNSLKQGLVPQHASFNKLNHKNPIEREADYFASCLLMPASAVNNFCFKRPLNSQLLDDIATNFNTSISSVIFRYFDLNLFPMMIIYSKDNIIQWHMATTDFKYCYIPKYGSPVPKTTTAGEFFNGGKKYPKEEIVFAGDWFTDFKKDLNQEIFEKCYYNYQNNSVMSVLWLKEKKYSF